MTPYQFGVKVAADMASVMKSVAQQQRSPMRRGGAVNNSLGNMAGGMAKNMLSAQPPQFPGRQPNWQATNSPEAQRAVGGAFPDRQNTFLLSRKQPRNSLAPSIDAEEPAMLPPEPNKATRAPSIDAEEPTFLESRPAPNKATPALPQSLFGR